MHTHRIYKDTHIYAQVSAWAPSSSKLFWVKAVSFEASDPLGLFGAVDFGVDSKAYGCL